MLYVVATPIGNLTDISYRAIEVLKTVSLIAAEDTRHSAILLKAFSVTTPLISLHDHNEHERSHALLAKLIKGESIALISDAGTPLISDPGYQLVRIAQEHHIRVIPVPGACAAVAALSASGLPTDRFVFEGFLPSKAQSRLTHLNQLANETRTLIFYESPNRVLESLRAMFSVFGNRIAVMARELTKIHETIHSAHLDDLIKWVENDSNQQRGEIVLLIEGNKNPNFVPSNQLLTELLEVLPLKKAVEIAAKISGEKKNELYDVALSMKKL